MSTGARIKELRLEHRLTQRQLANKLDVDPITVSRWERDETMPSDLNRVQIAHTFGVHPNQLVDDGVDAAKEAAA